MLKLMVVMKELLAVFHFKLSKTFQVVLDNQWITKIWNLKKFGISCLKRISNALSWQLELKWWNKRIKKYRDIYKVFRKKESYWDTLIRFWICNKLMVKELFNCEIRGARFNGMGIGQIILKNGLQKFESN